MGNTTVKKERKIREIKEDEQEMKLPRHDAITNNTEIDPVDLINIIEDYEYQFEGQLETSLDSRDIDGSLSLDNGYYITYINRSTSILNIRNQDNSKIVNTYNTDEISDIKSLNHGNFYIKLNGDSDIKIYNMNINKSVIKFKNFGKIYDIISINNIIYAVSVNSRKIKIFMINQLTMEIQLESKTEFTEHCNLVRILPNGIVIGCDKTNVIHVFRYGMNNSIDYDSLDFGGDAMLSEHYYSIEIKPNSNEVFIAGYIKMPSHNIKSFVLLFDYSTLVVMKKITFEGTIKNMICSRNKLVIFTEYGVSIWDDKLLKEEWNNKINVNVGISTLGKDGNIFYVVEYNNKTYLWHVDIVDKECSRFNIKNKPSSISILPNKRIVVTNPDNTIKIYR